MCIGAAEAVISGVDVFWPVTALTRSGGNRINSDHNFYFMNDALQGSNIDDKLRQRLGLRPESECAGVAPGTRGCETGAAGNPIDISYDWSSTLGGPIKRDKAWFFGALRWWRLDQFQVGALNPDGSQGIDEMRAMVNEGSGSIIITSSQHAFSTRPGGAAYASSKRALEGLAQSASQDYADQGLRVCVVAPGITDTPMFRRATGQSQEAVERANNLVRGLKRVAQPEEIARVALWLASEEAAYMTGTTVLADGGLLTGFA